MGCRAIGWMDGYKGSHVHSAAILISSIRVQSLTDLKIYYQATATVFLP
jgi:hypothetical protein